jgi:hypothetical protein
MGVITMPDINKDLLLSRIRHSGDFTALEKRLLMALVELATEPYCAQKREFTCEEEKKLLDDLKHAPIILNANQTVYPPLQVQNFGGDCNE